MEPTDREWRLIREEARPGAVQMALDEVAAETAADGASRTVRVYRWAPSCLSLGYNQPVDTVDRGFCEREGIDVTRRQTGGGGIYHDNWGDIAYSIVLPAEEVPGELLEAYHLLCEPVFDAFERLGVAAAFVDDERPAIHEPACYLRALHPAHDVVVGGRKIAGNAQYRRKDATIQHGSLTYEALPGRHLATFADPSTTPAAFRDRVTDVATEAGASRSGAVAALEDALAAWAGASEGGWTDAELERARQRADEKYGNADWIRERAAP